MDQDKDVAAVTSEPDGSAAVNWVKMTRLGPFYWRVGSYDELVFDESDKTWSVAFSPSF